MKKKSGGKKRLIGCLESEGKSMMELDFLPGSSGPKVLTLIHSATGTLIKCCIGLHIVTWFFKGILKTIGYIRSKKS